MQEKLKLTLYIFNFKVKPDQEKKPSGNEPFNSVMQRVLKERQERMQSEYCMNDDEAEGYDSDDWT